MDGGICEVQWSCMCVRVFTYVYRECCYCVHVQTCADMQVLLPDVVHVTITNTSSIHTHPSPTHIQVQYLQQQVVFLQDMTHRLSRQLAGYQAMDDEKKEGGMHEKKEGGMHEKKEGGHGGDVHGDDNEGGVEECPPWLVDALHLHPLLKV